MARYTCFNINFDTLAWAFSYPKDFIDPSFFDVIERFFDVSKQYDFKYTIFVTAKELENPMIAKEVKKWHEDGHEIGNHTYSHMQNLGSLRYEEMEEEVMRSHNLIKNICGNPPVGFTAPAWATSPDLVKVLVENGYLYDTSVFPSLFVWLMLARLRWNFRHDCKRVTIFQRKDKLAIFASRRPYLSDGKSLVRKSEDGILIIPLPTIPILRIPCWHTLSFFLPKKVFNSILRICLKEKYFYYLMHPTDLLNVDDVPIRYRQTYNIERFSVPFEKKLELFHKAIRTIIDNSVNIVTLKEMANRIISGEAR